MSKYPAAYESTRYEMRILDESGNDKLLGYTPRKAKHEILSFAMRPLTNAKLRTTYPAGETAWSGWQLVISVSGKFAACIGFSGRTEREAIAEGELPAFA